METPIVLLGFNRPEHSRRSLEAIAASRPTKVFFACDGPRRERSDDAARCAEVRALADTIDWECDVKTRFVSENLGCGLGPSSALDWVFGQVDRAIVIEDDCIAGPDLLPFFEDLLERYRSDERVGAIIGSRLAPKDVQFEASYTFGTEFSAQFGWATWARSWRQYDPTMQSWDESARARIARLAPTEHDAQHWIDIFDRAHQDWCAEGPAPDYWDYQFTFAMWRRGQLVARPAVHLARNVGFGPNATHTHSPNHPNARVVAGSLTWPLCHPDEVIRDEQADLRAAETRFAPWPRARRRRAKRFVRRTAKRILPSTTRAYLRERRSRT